MVLTGRFPRSLHLFPWTYCLYALRKKLLGSNKSALSKLLAPAGECIFDRFRWDFAKQDTNLASKSAPKGAKIHRRRAIRFDSREATSIIHNKSHLVKAVIHHPFFTNPSISFKIIQKIVLEADTFEWYTIFRNQRRSRA